MVATSAAALPTDPASEACAGCVINSPEALLSYTPPVGVLRPGTTYYWKVKATGPAGPSAWSSMACASAGPTCSPKVMVPRQTGVTRRSLRPRARRGREGFMWQVYGLVLGRALTNAIHCFFTVLR